MTALRANTARLVLDRVSRDDRAQVVEQVAKALDATSGAADVGFAATLLQLQPSERAKSVILAHLKDLVVRGDHALATAVCQDHVELKGDMFTALAEAVSSTATLLQASGRRWISAPVSSTKESKAAGGSEDESDNSLARHLEEAVNGLQFVVRMGMPTQDESNTRALLEACIVLVGAQDKRLSAAAQEVLYHALLPGQSSSIIEQETLWARIQSLNSSPDALYKTVGFSLWLRWSISANAPGPSILSQSEYWSLIVDGLGRGDGERRKAALQILRSSVQLATQDSSLVSMVATASAHDQNPSAVRAQYERFCTVFETIVFGRYLNQVQECEADLDFLSSSRSAVQPVWLYTLLSSALDQRFQDSNRKFIGTWIMRSNPRTDDLKGYLAFFRTAFLPWVTGGYMFTSTLRKKDDGLHCEHGEALAAYICQLLQSNSDIAGGIIDSILDSIIGRHGNNFAYAVVYLVDGVGKACAADSTLTLSDQQLEKLARIATWSGLPEIARDCILAHAWKLCHDHVQNDAAASHTEMVVSTAHHWDTLQDWVRDLGSSASAHVHGSIASLALEPSKRDVYEQKAIDKCVTLMKDLREQSPESKDPQQYESAIDDIFGDLDYLECPKSLCVVLPTVMPSKTLVEAALASNAGSLAGVISGKVMDMVSLAEVRSYMLSPFASALRDVILGVPTAAAVIPLDEVVTRLAERPPSPTPDAQLEDATVLVLHSLSPELAKLDYEFYFSRRESNGFAALLDMISRIGSVDADLNQRIFDHLLKRWATQKIPPPTVSAWKTALQLQVMFLSLEQLLPHASTATTANVLKHLHHILAVEPLPTYRYLLEWMIARIYLHYPELKSKIFEELATKDHHSNPKFLASLMKLGVMIAKTESSNEVFAKDLAAIFVPLAASSKVVIRHEAQWQIPLLMDHARDRSWTSITEDSAFKALDDFIRSLERFGNPPFERRIDKLDPVKDNNLTHLVEGPWWDLDTVEQCRTSREDFVRLYATEKGDSMPKACMPKACMPLGELHTRRPAPEADSVTTARDQRKILQNIDNISRALGSGPVAVPTAASTALQTKGAAYLESSRTRFSNLLVVASLVDNPYNLGGLSRVSEIFGAGGMYLANPNVTSNKDFTGVSVSSHLHFPILALPAEGIPECLAKKKHEDGFKVVGIEQTDRSVMLGSKGCVLPEKCILVMGSEREGIPALVLSECDVLVEIRQVGVTRSLNVQTACGIVLSEWVRQHG